MPPYVKYRVDQAIVTIQWSGDWEDPTYAPGNLDAFPGIQIPPSLLDVAAKVQGGAPFWIDLGLGQTPELRKAIVPIFDHHTIGKGPPEGGTWALLGNGDPTTGEKIRWVPTGVPNGLAYAVGTRPSNPYSVAYDFPPDGGNPAMTGTVRFLLMFLFVQVT